MAAAGPGPYPVSARQPVRIRRRRPLPAISLLVVLGVVATIVWIRTFDGEERSAADKVCAPPGPALSSSELPADPAQPPAQPPAEPAPTTTQPQPGAVLDANGLDAVEPLPPDAVKVRVLNGNGERGQASLIAAELTTDLGFAKAAEPGNDPVYPAWDLSCHAQIRFGTVGEPAARTLSLVVPCAELVRDARPDDTVDLALGKQFESLNPNAAARQALRKLTELASIPPDPTGGQQATDPTVEPSLVAAARQADC